MFTVFDNPRLLFVFILKEKRYLNLYCVFERKEGHVVPEASNVSRYNIQYKPLFFKLNLFLIRRNSLWVYIECYFATGALM